MNASSVSILKEVKKKKHIVHPLALSYSNFQTRLEPKSTQEMRHHRMLFVFQIQWVLITVFPSLVYLFRRSENLESNVWILWHPKAKAKSATGNVHPRVAVGIRDATSAIIPRYSIGLILRSFFSPGIFSPVGFILLGSKGPDAG